MLLVGRGTVRWIVLAAPLILLAVLFCLVIMWAIVMPGRYRNAAKSSRLVADLIMALVDDSLQGAPASSAHMRVSAASRRSVGAEDRNSDAS